MEEKTVMCISVRNLVEFILREGDIENRRSGYSDRDAMQAGTRIHRKLQKQMNDHYRAEVTLKKQWIQEPYDIKIEGRADGIFEEDGQTYIDEIKGVFRDLVYLEKPINIHRAQAMCYAYLFAEQTGKTQIWIQMTYVNLETEEIKRFQEKFEFVDLEKWFLNILAQYQKWMDFKYEARKNRQKSIEKIVFPFPYRRGQKELVISVYRSIEREKTLFIQAPTGVGKTISVIFPALKAIGEELAEKIFYLTAKTITQTVAQETFEQLRGQGLFFQTVGITAKEKLCFLEERDCNPDACPYAKGHYDRVNDAVYDLVTHECGIGREEILFYAKKYKVCPFEMELDVTDWVDGILCDYNYVFDPSVKLKRYFSEGKKGEYLFLIDEAHNLVERAREMYSAELLKNSFLKRKRQMKSLSSRIEKSLAVCNQDLLCLKRECETYEVLENAGGFVIHLLHLAGELEGYLEEHADFPGKTELMEFYFDVRNFLEIHENMDDGYRIYTEHTEDGDFRIKLLCVHTAKNIRACLNTGVSAVLFSATFLPIQYYRDLLSGNPEDYAIYAETAFQPEKRLLLQAMDVSSRYTRRCKAEYERIYRYLEGLLCEKTGNYIFFFPSYHFLEAVHETALSHGLEKRAEILVQTSHMKEEEKEAFLREFDQIKEGRTLAAFCVLGGIFSEGIDLKEERLIGAAIVGTGLPQVCNEREILKDYYEERCGDGFDYAYRYPGMNKVLQAAGRVIRTAKDEGVILLLDDRFSERRYRDGFPREWSDIKQVRERELNDVLRQFWKEREKKE